MVEPSVDAFLATKRLVHAQEEMVVKTIKKKITDIFRIL
jgi:hypothetical protein